MDGGYWFANVRRMVRFEEAVRGLLGVGFGAFVEVSPHPVLTAAITETAEDAEVENVLTVGTLTREDAGAARVLRALGEAYVGGLSVDWRKVLPAAEVVELPTYAFRRRRYWLESSAAEAAAGGDAVPGGVEERFWAAVEGGDLSALADSLSAEDRRDLLGVLPVLA
ncbi:acyltransferase domain-containing protein, partial [Actinacidiphila sp. bgisy144]|uniref:acyltransferase domain-containing protein n=1 Tax=Actinacidiphila sp. bgisy144 TaxID=3413791 RepID=UPI003EB87F53